MTPILTLTPSLAIARRLALAWGLHPVPFDDVREVAEMIDHATDAALRLGVAQPGDIVAIVAGLPFGQTGSTNLLHVARVPTP